MTQSQGDGAAEPADRGELTPDELQLAFHEVECRTYDERFGITYDEHAAREAARETRRLLGDARLGRVLDVGCGTGYLGLGLAAAGRVDELHLVDLSPGMLGRAREHAETVGVDARLVRATAARLPYPDASVDAIVTRGVLHHLDDVPAALREWRRVVRPGGPVLVLSEPTDRADRIGATTARSTLAALRGARALARAAGRPLSELEPDARREHDFWDVVAMAANLHTFAPRDLETLARDAGFRHVRVRGAGLASIVWATVYYVLAGELPDLAASARARRRSGRVFAALRRLDGALVERLVPDGRLMTVQAVLRA